VTAASTPGTGRGAVPAVLASADADGRTVLLEHEVYALLAAVGIAVPAHRFLATADAVDDAVCAALGTEEAVVKVVSPDVLHKSDVGGIAFCRNEAGALRPALVRVLRQARLGSPGAHIAGALVAERIPYEGGTGRELLAAFRHDPAFGPVVVLGVGGLDTEALLASLRPERARAMWPAAALTAEEAIQGLRGTLAHAALTGGLRTSRGAGTSEASLAGLVVALARLAESWAGFAPEGGLGLSELEVNPLVLARDGRLVALDGLARLHRPAPLPPARPVAELRRLLTPSSAVVIGASATGMNPGRIILRNLAAGGGVARERVFALHPSAQEIDGCRATARRRW
jgi:hypothetical protein